VRAALSACGDVCRADELSRWVDVLAAAGAGGPLHAAQLARGQRVVSVDVAVGRSSSRGNEGQTDPWGAWAIGLSGGMTMSGLVYPYHTNQKSYAHYGLGHGVSLHARRSDSEVRFRTQQKFRFCARRRRATPPSAVGAARSARPEIFFGFWGSRRSISLKNPTSISRRDWRAPKIVVSTTFD
jgi:hypothetical protein